MERCNKKRVLWVADNLTTGGIGTVCRYAAEAVARIEGWRSTVVSIRPSPSDEVDPLTGVRYVALGLNRNAPREFLKWLSANPQEFVITNDVDRIEAAFPFFPADTCHIVGIHDSLRRILDVAVRNGRVIDGVASVARHLEQSLQTLLEAEGFRGLLETIYNGAAYPPLAKRPPHCGPLRLLYIGRMDPFKGIFDLVTILRELRKAGVPFELTIVGGRYDELERRFVRYGLESSVTWSGWVPHEDCYRIAEAHDVLLMPSRKEAFGLVTVEAMAMGCVPITYDIRSGSREIIENHRSGLLLSLGNLRAWANAIARLHENREEWARLSLGAMERARTRFTAELMASHWCDFLERVRAHSSVQPPLRQRGEPMESYDLPVESRASYQRLPPALRLWIRNWVGSRPRLCYWLLNR